MATFHHGWLFLDEPNGFNHELFNHARTAAYLQSSPVLGCGQVYGVLDDGGCPAYRWVPPNTLSSDILTDSVGNLLTDEDGNILIGVDNQSVSGWYEQTYTNPIDDLAPWYNPAFPESGEALGFWVTEWTGLDSGHIQRELTQVGNYGGGGVFGAMGNNAREMGFEVILIGESERALDYLYRWLDATLASVCATCATSAIYLRRYCTDTSTPDGLISSTWNLTVGAGNANISGAAVYLGGLFYLNDLDSDGVDRSAALAAITEGSIITIGEWSYTVSSVQDNSTHYQYTGMASGTPPTDGEVTVISKTFTASDGVVEMRGVGLMSGLQWGAPPVQQGGCFMRRVNFTMAATDPCMYGFCTDVEVSQLMDWDACFTAANLNPDRVNCRPNCSEMDGLCRLTFDYTVDDPSAVAPIITLVAPTDASGSIPMRIRTYANGSELLPEELCGAPLLGELYITSLPPYSELRYDVAARKVEFRSAATGGYINGYAYVAPNEPGVPRFFALGCGDFTTVIEPADYCFASAPSDTREFAEVTLETRSRMGCA
jgi:hypothetical protein